METNQPLTVDAQHRNMLILWAAFLGAIVMYGFMSLVMDRQTQVSNRMLTIVFSAISVFAVGVSFAIKKKFVTRAIEEQQMRTVNTGFIVAAAFCELGAIMGLLDFLVANDRYYFLLIGLAFIGWVLHFPRRSDLEAASYKKLS